MNTTTMKKAAFKIGDRLEYVGDRQALTEVKGKIVPIIFKGMIVTITETRPPSKGHGWVQPAGHDEPFFDADDDGYNVYVNAAGQGRIIWPKNKNDWKKL